MTFDDKVLVFGFLTFLLPFLVVGQSTVGLIEYSDDLSDSYTLFTPLSSESTYLIDNCGHKINEWTGLQPSNSNLAYLAEDGSLIRASFNTFQKISWDNEVLWSYSVADLELLRHHDFHILPNGNILFIASKVYEVNQIADKGRNVAGISNGGGASGFKVDGIYELSPIGTEDAELVWEWNFFDHLVQDFDIEKLNFDSVSNQPRRLDVNFNGEEGTAFDWLHCNGIDYNADLDQIIISSRSTCELYVIDHSTTTEEAATSFGGTYGFGGDFLWRWGNPIAYDRGTESDQQFWEQHDPKWIKNGYPNEGLITVYNNLFNFRFDTLAPHSKVHILNPNEINGVYPIAANETFEPTNFHFTFSGEVVGNQMWSSIMSSVQAMPNGNLFINQGETGEMLEVNLDKEVVWVYQNPVREFIYEQGSDPLSLDSAVDIFITTKYPVDFQGFANYSMIPIGVLENENELSEICNPTVTKVETPINISNIYPNPANDFLSIETTIQDYEIRIYDLLGNAVLYKKGNNNDIILLRSMNAGIYFLTIEKDHQVVESLKVVVH